MWGLVAQRGFQVETRIGIEFWQKAGLTRRHTRQTLIQYGQPRLPLPYLQHTIARQPAGIKFKSQIRVRGKVYVHTLLISVPYPDATGKELTGQTMSTFTEASPGRNLGAMSMTRQWRFSWNGHMKFALDSSPEALCLPRLHGCFW